VSVDERLSERIQRGTGADEVELGARVQSLWGGYGEIRRVELLGASARTAIVKSVTPPAEREFARDAAKLRSHRRKVRSYAVELEFYRRFARATDASCRVPGLLHGEAGAGDFLFVFEDLDAAGFPARRSQCSAHEIAAGLGWLASFHARFVGVAPEGLWNVGTYWHLATRPDELAALGAHPLRRAAPRIDERLNQARFKTLLHGDAKLENFCFSRDGSAVAAVDFQYVGGGVGVKDLAYYLGSCLSVKACATEVPRYLERYFAALRAELAQHAPSVDAAALEAEWRELFTWAWVDFQRFLLGWAPSYAAGDAYSERLTAELLARV
jgi:Phosphotransferase enzyme family